MQRELRIIAAFGAVAGIIYIVAAMRLRVGNLVQPGPAMYPLFVGCLILLGSVALALSTMSRIAKTYVPVKWPRGASLWRVMAVISGCIGYVVLLPWVGQCVAGGITSLAVLRAMKEYRWPVMIAIAAGMGVGSYFLFVVVLKVPLPSGKIWWR